MNAALTVSGTLLSTTVACRILSTSLELMEGVCCIRAAWICAGRLLCSAASPKRRMASRCCRRAVSSWCAPDGAGLLQLSTAGTNRQETWFLPHSAQVPAHSARRHPYTKAATHPRRHIEFCLRTTESRGHPPRRRHRGARCKHTCRSVTAMQAWDLITQ